MKSWYDLTQYVDNDGQSDSLTVEVPMGAFVVPAMAVAHLGRGSSSAGHEYLENLVDGSEEPKGAWDNSGRIKVARDEHILMPWEVAELGNGDIKEGARFLEKLIEELLGEPVGHKVEN